MQAGSRHSSTPDPMHLWDGHGGIKLAGDLWGNPDGPPVILQHGGGQTRHAWKNLGETLGAAGYHTIALDARGHGDSSWSPDGGYSPDVMVNDLKCIVAALGQRRPVLVGASMGGVTSLISIGEAHLEAAALVLVDIAPQVESEGVDKIMAFMSQKPEGFSSLEEVAEAVGNYQPNRKRSTNLDGLVKNLRLAADGRYHWHWDPRFIDARREFDGMRDRLEACVRRLTLPTLLVRGGLSDVLTEDGAQRFRALCPHSEYINVTDAAHMVAGDRNDVFGGTVVEFLSRRVPAAVRV